jgi:hypothetical protein
MGIIREYLPGRIEKYLPRRYSLAGEMKGITGNEEVKEYYDAQQTSS